MHYFNFQSTCISIRRTCKLQVGLGRYRRTRSRHRRSLRGLPLRNLAPRCRRRCRIATTAFATAGRPSNITWEKTSEKLISSPCKQQQHSFSMRLVWWPVLFLCLAVDLARSRPQPQSSIWEVVLGDVKQKQPEDERNRLQPKEQGRTEKSTNLETQLEVLRINLIPSLYIFECKSFLCYPDIIKLFEKVSDVLNSISGQDPREEQKRKKVGHR
jgi:hypothetical protein